MKTVKKKQTETLKKAVILLSGGMDSATLLYHVRKTLKYGRIYAITFAYRQKHRRELDCAAWQARAACVDEHIVVDLSFFRRLIAGSSILTDPKAKIPDLSAIKPSQRDQPPTYVPHRNLLFLTLAAAYAEAKGVREIYYGAQRQDSYGYWDCTPGFLKRLNRVLVISQTVEVHAEIAQRYKKLLQPIILTGAEAQGTVIRGLRQRTALALKDVPLSNVREQLATEQIVVGPSRVLVHQISQADANHTQQ